MISSDPAADWDRYCRSQEGPMPVGKGRTVRSARAHQCESCWGPIPAWQRHEMIAQIDDEGLFTTPLRLHLKGECTYPEEEM